MSRSRIILTAVLVLWMGVAALAEVIFLKDGRLLQVQLLSGTEKGIEVRRLDTGGHLFIRWELLRDEDRQRLRIEFGLDDDLSGADLQMPGQRIYTIKGDDYDGVVVPHPEDQERVYLRTVKGEIPFLRSAIRRIEDRLVSKFDVYTPEELYQQELDRRQPADDDLQAQFAMARWAAKVGLYAKAVEHYQKVQSIDPEFRTDYVANQLKRLEVLDRRKEIRNGVREADLEAARRHFDVATGLLDELLSLGDLDDITRKEIEKKKERVLKKRWSYYRQQVAREYRRQVDRLIRKVAADKNIGSADKEKRVSIDKAMSYVRSQLHKDVVEAIAKKFSLDPKKEVEKMWEDRPKGARRTASYGSGTFIVMGEKKVQDAGGGGNRQVQELINRLRRNRRGGRNQPQAQPQQQKLVTKEQWWVRASMIQRSFFLRAYFAENAKKFEVLNTFMRPCPTCGATGTIKELGSQGGIVRRTCPRCHGNKGDRTVNVR